MKKNSVVINSFSALGSDGIETSRGFIAWESDQAGPQDIKRSQVLAAPYMAFGKLNLPDKLAFSAASLALRDCPVTNPETTGIFLGIPCGSLSTDLLYRESVEQGNPGPALFAATLPSSPVSDIAIYHHIKGPDIAFSGGDSPFLSALEYASLQLNEGALTAALVVFVDENVRPLQNDTSSVLSRVPPCAFALMIGTAATPSSPALLFDRSTDTSDSSFPVKTDPELLSGLMSTLRKKESHRIPVSAGGFIGYISLHYSRKEG